MPFTLPRDVSDRPVAVDGGGALGRRIASVYVAGGTDVHLHDVSSDQLEACIQFVADSVDEVQSVLDVHPSGGAGDIAVYEILARPSVGHGWSWRPSPKTSP